jgi:hypothetical protein
MTAGARRGPSTSRFLAWGALAGLAAFTGLMALLHGGAVLNFVFTPLALAVALTLFRVHPSLYLEFVLWMWMLAPLVRRLADWQSGFHALSPIMVAPQLVTAVSVLSVWSVAGCLGSRRFAPYFAILVVYLWGYFVGVLQSGLLPASYDFLNWACPVFLAIHLLSRPHSVEANSDAIFRALTWGVLVVGVYGVRQYFAVTDWDRQWMLATVAELGTIGEAVAQQARVFSTMNSPGPFAVFMAGGLIALFAARGRVRWLAAAPGLAALMLSLVRSAWGGLIVGLVVLFAGAPMRRRVRLALAGAALIALATPFLVEGPIAEKFQARLATIANLETDNSYLARQEFYESFFATAASSISGVGLGKAGLASRLSSSDASLGEYGNFDSGVMNLLFTFGLAAPLLGGLILFLFFRAAIAGRRTPEGAVCVAIAASTLSQMIFVNTFAGVSGMFVLPMIALAEAQVAVQGAKATTRGSVSAVERAKACAVRESL